MLLGNPANNNGVAYKESFAQQLFSEGRYSELYQILINSKDSISKHYNLALCFFWAEDDHQALLSLDKAFNKLPELNRKQAFPNNPISEKIQNKQKQTNDFFSFLSEEYVKTFPSRTFDHCIRFKVECLKKLEQWNQLLQTASLIENKKYQNVMEAIELANKNIKHG